MKRLEEQWPPPYFSSTDRACLWCLGFVMVITATSGLAYILWGL